MYTGILLLTKVNGIQQNKLYGYNYRVARLKVYEMIK